MRRRSALRAFAAAAFAFLLIPAALAAQERTPAEAERVAREAMSQLRSPYFAGHTLDMCPSADALRDTVFAAAASGESVDALREGVIARYGEELRILPRREGVGLWAWLAPPAVLLLGLATVIGRLRSLRGSGREEDQARALSVDERAELDAALAAFDRDDVGER